MHARCKMEYFSCEQKDGGRGHVYQYKRRPRALLVTSMGDPSAFILSIREILFSMAAYISGVQPDAASTTSIKGKLTSPASPSAKRPCCFSTALKGVNWIHALDIFDDYYRRACSHPAQSFLWAKIKMRRMATSCGTSLPRSPIWYPAASVFDLSELLDLVVDTFLGINICPSLLARSNIFLVPGETFKLRTKLVEVRWARRSLRLRSFLFSSADIVWLMLLTPASIQSNKMLIFLE